MYHTSNMLAPIRNLISSKKVENLWFVSKSRNELGCEYNTVDHSVHTVNAPLMTPLHLLMIQS